METQMRRNLMRCALVAILLAPGMRALFSDEPAKPKDPPKEAPAVDILNEAKAWNSDKFIAPPTEFRTGHVTPRELDDKAVSKTDLGFVVQLPSKAPIPTRNAGPRNRHESTHEGRNASTRARPPSRTRATPMNVVHCPDPPAEPAWR